MVEWATPDTLRDVIGQRPGDDNAIPGADSRRAGRMVSVAGHPARRASGVLFVTLGATGFALSQPMLGLLGDNPLVFAGEGVTGWTVAVFALSLAFLVPLFLWMAQLVVMKVNATWGFLFHVSLVGVMVLATMLQATKQLLPTATTTALLAVVVAASFCLLYSRVRAVAEWAQLTAVLPVLSVVMFVFASPSGELIGGLRDTGDRSAQADGRPPVVFLLLDEFPTRLLLGSDRTLDERRFPNLARFAEDAVWYRNFTSNSPFTGSAVPSMLTGRMPGRGNEVPEPVWTDHPDSLFALLEPTHHLRVFETATHLCGVSSCSERLPGEDAPDASVFAGVAAVAAESVDMWSERVDPRVREGGSLDDYEEPVEAAHDLTLDELFGSEFAVALPSRFSRFIEGLVPTEEPVLHFLHLMLPHGPWRFYSTGDVYRPPVPFRSAGYLTGNEVPWLSALAEQRSMLQASYADRLVGLMIGQLERSGLYDDALVVVCADHGASFTPGTEMRVASEETLDEVAFAPLFLKPPRHRDGRVDDSNVMAIDLLPTIADVVGVDVPWQVDGVPAGDPALRRRGGTKRFVLMRKPFTPEVVGTVEFETEVMAPRAEDRAVRSEPEDPDDLVALWDILGLSEFRGRRVGDIITGAGGTAHVVGLDDLEQRPGDVPVGLVIGTLTGDVPDGAMVLIGIDGEVVAASDVYDREGSRNEFAAMLPNNALGPEEEHYVEVAVVHGQEVIETTVEGA